MFASFSELSAAFLEGFLLTISPCILSILPILFSGSMDSVQRWRPAGIILGLLISFIFFSLFLGEIFQVLGLRPEVLKLIAAFCILSFGLIMVFPSLTSKFYLLTSGLAQTGNILARKANDFKSLNGLLSGLLVGTSLGLIWTPCIGPLLGSAIIQASSQTNLLQNFSIITSFCLGIACPLFTFLVLSQRLMVQINFLKQYSKPLQQIFGSIMIVSVLLSSKPSISFAQDWIKFKFLGGRSVQTSEMPKFKVGCPLSL